MTDTLRDRISAAIADQIVNDGGAVLRRHGEGNSVQLVVDTTGLADAVIAALPELTQPVSVEPIGDFQYVCHPCGSSFSFYSSSTMQQFALMHSGSHHPKDADD